MPRVSKKSDAPPVTSAAELIRPEPLGPPPQDIVSREGGMRVAKDDDLKHVVQLAREKTVDSIQTLHGIMMNEKNSPAVRRQCAVDLLDRGWGTAPKRVSVKNEIGDGLQPHEIPTPQLEALASELLSRQKNIVDVPVKQVTNDNDPVPEG